MIKTEILHKACIKLVQAMSIFHAIFARENPFHPAQVFLNETLCKLPNNFVFFFFFCWNFTLTLIDTFSISLLYYSHYDFIQSLTQLKKILKAWDL